MVNRRRCEPSFRFHSLAETLSIPALCSAADVNGDKKVTQEDVREVASRMGARTGDSRFSAKSDVVADGVINVQDTFKVLVNVGLTCPN